MEAPSEDLDWHVVAAQQQGLLALSQLPGLGVSRGLLRNQLRAGRWSRRTDRVVSVVTGELTRVQFMWLGVLHAQNGALLGGLTAAEVHGLRGWHRDDVTVLVPDDWSFGPVPGIGFFRTRRPLAVLRAPVTPSSYPPVCRLEPAVLMFAGYATDARSGQGAVAACVQQRLTTPPRCEEWIERLRPLRRSRLLRTALADMAGGAQSVAEIDVRRMCRRTGLPQPTGQTPRLDRDGRQRFTDAEWVLPDGTVVVLEVDGGFHAEVRHYDDDLRRQRKLTTTGRVIVRCSAYEMRHDPDSVARDLRALGVGAPQGRVL